jgi:hypothetical protein
MPAVVTQASTVTCGHGGTVITAGSPKLTVDGSPVLVAAGIVGKPLPVLPAPGHCLTPTSSSPVSKPCASVLTVTTPSLATKLFVSGAPVALATLKGTTDGVVPVDVPPTPQTLLAAVVTQTHLTAV